MRSSLVLLVSIVASAAGAPLGGPRNGRLFPWNTSEFPVSTEAEIVTDKDAPSQPAKKQSEKSDVGTTDSSLPSVTTHDREETDDALGASAQGTKASKKNRKHKAIVLDYLSKLLPYPAGLPRDMNYNNYDTVETRTSSTSNRLPDSNIFYVRLPPTPYMFIPGIGYISQPPRYSTTSLRPQFVKPTKQKPAQKQQSGKPFIKLPVDFVSNGKPTSVYQWQKHKTKKPADSPIMNLDGMTADFNGKPSTIYQWQSNLKPVKKTDDLVNVLDKGPYYFNGKPSTVYQLNPDGTSKLRQAIRYQRDNSYY